MDVIDKITSEEGGPAHTPVTQLDQLVGEGKRYASSEELAKGRVKADDYIKQLEGENKEMRSAVEEAEGLAKRASTVEDLLAEVRKASAGTGDTNSTVQAVDIQAIVDEKFGKRDADTKATLNRAKVSAAIAVNHPDPDKAAAFVWEKAQEVGLSKEELKRLSETTPDALIAILGVKPVTSRETQPNLYGKQNVNTSALPPSGNEVRNQAYYAKLRKEMGAAAFFNDRKVQAQKFQDAEVMGESYYT